jgi:uncharacterized protein
MNPEYKICDLSELEIKAGANGTGELSGYAATFGNKDRVGDIIVRGAFIEGIAEFKEHGFIAVGHDHNSLPVATVKDAYEDERGLKITAEFHSTPEAQAARTIAQERLMRGKSVALSIGFTIKEGGEEYTQDSRLLKRLQLFETSLVNIPANPMALVTGVKDVTATEASFDTRLLALATEAEECAEVARKHLELRLKEGRVMAERRRSRLTSARDALAAMLTEIDELLAEAAPPAKETEEQAEEEPKAVEVPVRPLTEYDIKSREADVLLWLTELGIRTN